MNPVLGTRLMETLTWSLPDTKPGIKRVLELSRDWEKLTEAPGAHLQKMGHKPKGDLQMGIRVAWALGEQSGP